MVVGHGALVFGFGTHTVHIYHVAQGASHLLATTGLRNDDANVYTGNFAVHRHGPVDVNFALNGEEQAPEDWSWFHDPDINSYRMTQHRLQYPDEHHQR